LIIIVIIYNICYFWIVYYTLLAKNLKKYRQILGLSQAELAEKLNCSTTFIGNIEIKKRFPSPKNLDHIVKVLGIKPADLFAEVDNPEGVAQFKDKQKRKKQLEKDIQAAIDRFTGK
jgi:transcriptional regulator with XRE-family HTH domain